MSEYVVCPTCAGAGVISTGPGSADDDHTLRAVDQTDSDRDQTWSDHDQTLSDRDQESAEQDQRASDEDFAAGSDPAAHERSSTLRARTTLDRADVSRLRDETAAARFRIGAEPDERAELDDRAADERDRLAALSESTVDASASDADIRLRTQRDRERAALDRVKAAEDRARASVDRRHAAQERAEALQNWAEARRDLALAVTDELTGAWTRRFGLASINREIERAGRTGRSLALAFVDVDALKEVNDTLGHAEGDRVLRLVAETLRDKLRSYDLVVRYGGDEFVCAMPDLTVATAKERVETIAAAVAAADPRHTISFGLAEYRPGDGLDELVGRADANLLGARRSPGHG